MHILYSHISICPLSPCFLRPFLSLLPLFLLFRAFYNLWTVLRGCFTSTGLIHLSLLLSSPFPFLSSLFPLFSLSFLPSLPFLSLTPCRFLVRRPPPCRTVSDGPGSDLKLIKHRKQCWVTCCKRNTEGIIPTNVQSLIDYLKLKETNLCFNSRLQLILARLSISSHSTSTLSPESTKIFSQTF